MGTGWRWDPRGCILPSLWAASHLPGIPSSFPHLSSSPTNRNKNKQTNKANKRCLLTSCGAAATPGLKGDVHGSTPWRAAAGRDRGHGASSFSQRALGSCCGWSCRQFEGKAGLDSLWSSPLSAPPLFPELPYRSPYPTLLPWLHQFNLFKGGVRKGGTCYLLRTLQTFRKPHIFLSLEFVIPIFQMRRRKFREIK